MRLFNVLLSILVSLLMAFLVFEVGLGLMPAFRSQVRLNQFDAQLGWSKKPNHSGRRSTSEFNVCFETNAQGLREPADIQLPKPEGCFRVLLLGDSFVLGYTVAERQVFGSLLEDQLRAEGYAVEVINAGTEGYSTDQAAAWLIDQGLTLEPDLVLLFPYENDLYWNSQRAYNGSPKPRFLGDGSREAGRLEDTHPGEPWHQRWATGRFLQYLARSLMGSTLSPERGFEVQGVEGRILKEFGPLLVEPPDFVEACIEHTRGALMALRDACSEAQVPLAMLPIPSESAIHPSEREAFRTSDQGLRSLPDEAWSPDLPVQRFLDLADELGIEKLDAREHLRERGEEQALYFQAEWHLNPAGNQALASFLRAELDRRGMLPAVTLGADERDPLVSGSDSPGVPTRYLVFLTLWLFLGLSFCATYRDERPALAFLKVGLLLAIVFSLVLGTGALLERYPGLGLKLLLPLFLLLAGFILYKLGRRIGTIMELMQAFTLRGHWYLMPLVMVLLSIGSLLVVAASSPLVAPFIYTLF